MNNGRLAARCGGHEEEGTEKRVPPDCHVERSIVPDGWTLNGCRCGLGGVCSIRSTSAHLPRELTFIVSAYIDTQYTAAELEIGDFRHRKIGLCLILRLELILDGSGKRQT